MLSHLYAARCILAALGNDNPSDDALIGGSILAEACHHLRELGRLAARFNSS